MEPRAPKWNKVRAVIKPKERNVGTYHGLKQTVVQALLVPPGKRSKPEIAALLSYFGMRHRSRDDIMVSKRKGHYFMILMRAARFVSWPPCHFAVLLWRRL